MSFDRQDGNDFRGNGTEAVAYMLPGTVRSRLERYGDRSLQVGKTHLRLDLAGFYPVFCGFVLISEGCDNWAVANSPGFQGFGRFGYAFSAWT
jgi:hypothetical protein